MTAESTASGPDIGPVLAFLRCRTPRSWVEAAARGADTILLDHASLELKAAQQAQTLIRRYGVARSSSRARLGRLFRSRLVSKMSRLAREELRHFEQVVALIERRGGHYSAVSPSRYASGLHGIARNEEPGALLDSLIIGAVIEARSCERFFSLIEEPGRIDESIAKLYASLLRSEARHFEDYLELARQVPGFPGQQRIEPFLARDAQLVESPDMELRFLSGAPEPGGPGPTRSL